MKPLGVGLVFAPALLPLLRESEVVSVIEIEPQTLWQLTRAGSAGGYAVNAQLLEELVAAPQPKILHSVGVPVASSRPLDRAQSDLINSMARSLG
jgi:hypothetical protein